ncbi:MAG: hypothetical protein LBR16_06365 [Treponema sp.]|jgi:hypothetical protein|nr:hypothetical protein [Treponema sp.]
MTRGILIAGNDSPLLNALGAEAGNRVDQYAAALLPGGGGAAKHSDRKRAALPWSLGSPISTRTLIVSAENRLSQINEAIFVCAPPSLCKSPGDLELRDIEAIVNEQIKAWLWLIREQFLYFSRQGAGTLAFVAPEPAPQKQRKGGSADLLGPTAAAAFRAFASGVLASPRDDALKVLGFTVKDALLKDNEARIAAWIFKAMEETSPKHGGVWRRYSKFSFMNTLKSPLRFLPF